MRSRFSLEPNPRVCNRYRVRSPVVLFDERRGQPSFISDDRERIRECPAARIPRLAELRLRFERLVGLEVAMKALQDGLRQRKVTVAQLSRVEDILPSRRPRRTVHMSRTTTWIGTVSSSLARVRESVFIGAGFPC